MDFYKNDCKAFFHPGGYELTKKALLKCGMPNGAVIADIGCGTGDGIERIKLDYPAARVIGLEPTAQNGKVENIIRASAENTTLESGSIDVALCECVLSLCGDLKIALSEMRRILKTDGVLIYSDMYSRGDGFIGSGALKNMYSLGTITNAVERSGFVIEDTSDHTAELAEMYGQMIFDGTADSMCMDISREEIKKCGYMQMIARKIV